MKNTVTAIIVLLTVALFSCKGEKFKTSISSPGNINTIKFFISEDGTPNYMVLHKNKVIIDTSGMGFDFKNQPPLSKGLKISGSSLETVNNTWEMPWGERRIVKNHYNESIINLQETTPPNRRLKIFFRAYDDGIGFRYELLSSEKTDSVIIMDENTSFKLTGDHLCWWIPGDWDIYEHLYQTTRLSEINATKLQNNSLAQSYIPENAVNTPFTMKTAEGLHLSFHEANLTNYAGMTLKKLPGEWLLKSELVGSDRLGYKVKRALPFKTPWRTIQIAEEAGDLIESSLIPNLNQPNKLGNVSWFEPMKYAGIWWEMHLGISSWAMTGGNHGATTENAKRYIDFAAANNIKGVLVEGWNTGWENWVGIEDREGIFDFVTPYQDYNLEEVVKYAKEKGVEIIMHHETSAAPRTYEKQLDTACKLMNRLGLHTVKTGYVGTIIPKGEYHHGQWMVNHYRKVLKTAAKYHVAVNAHEPIKATGIRRTYPNAVSREGVRGQEFNAWSADQGNPPEHLPIVAFTRMLAGPVDFTPGAFELSLPSRKNNRVNTTLAHQLALYVVIYSPVQMACDLPKNYKDQPAFQFIRDVGVDWEQTLVLNGEVGDFVTIARKERKTGNWFVGSITDEKQREISINFNFLEAEKVYEATIYKDGKNANYKTNPLTIEIESIKLSKESVIKFKLGKGGGLAMSIIPEN